MVIFFGAMLEELPDYWRDLHGLVLGLLQLE